MFRSADSQFERYKSIMSGQAMQREIIQNVLNDFISKKFPNKKNILADIRFQRNVLTLTTRRKIYANEIFFVRQELLEFLNKNKILVNNIIVR